MFVPKFVTDDTQAGSLPGSYGEATADKTDKEISAVESADSSNNVKADLSSTKNNADNKEASNKPDEEDSLFPHQPFK